MTLAQIRSIYPELSDISDQDLLEGLRLKYNPSISSKDFADQYVKNIKPFEDFIIAGLYGSRGDAYLNKGNYKKAAIDYARAKHDDSTYALGRWHLISKTSDTEYYVDAQTLDFSKGNIVSLWLKSLYTNTQSYDQQNYQIDCSSRKIKSVSATSYNSLGSVTNTGGELDWQSINPDSIGEILYNGMCQN
jgi:hypothetical protein